MSTSPPATYTATLTVEDRRGGRASASVPVTVTAALASPGPGAKAPDAAPAQAPWFGVSEPVKTSVSGFAKRGLSVRVTCTQAMSGSATLTVTSAVARKLGLKRTTLASTAVKCAGAGSKTVKLKPSAATRRALARSRARQGQADRDPRRRAGARGHGHVTLART